MTQITGTAARGRSRQTAFSSRRQGLLAVGLAGLILALAPHAVADTNDNAYVNVMDENNIHSVGGLADLIYAGHQVCGFTVGAAVLRPNDVSPTVIRRGAFAQRSGREGHRRQHRRLDFGQQHARDARASCS
jgi:hypothetical protein